MVEDLLLKAQTPIVISCGKYKKWGNAPFGSYGPGGFIRVGVAFVRLLKQQNWRE
jgi:hypothetical protein